MTYGELKLFSMQKMFHDITELTENSVTKPYLEKMPYVAACAITRTAALGFAKKKSVQITKIAIRNELENLQKKDIPYTITEKDVAFEAESGKAYYFECAGHGRAEIFVDEKSVKTVSFDTNAVFVKFRGIIENTQGSRVKIVFRAGEPYLVRNPAVYNADFAKEEDILENGEYTKYNLKKLTTDFFRFDSERFVEEKCGDGESTFRFCGECEIEIKNDASGSWNVPYLAYPTVINEKTADNEKIDLPCELCMILPFYIASELYLEEDSALAVGWRNKFETSLYEYASLKNRKGAKKAEVVTLKGAEYGAI